jgi:hypothetical protein
MFFRELTHIWRKKRKKTKTKKQKKKKQNKLLSYAQNKTMKAGVQEIGKDWIGLYQFKNLFFNVSKLSSENVPSTLWKFS